MERDYLINKSNSTILGYPGRQFDWGKFDWKGQDIYEEQCGNKGCDHKHVAPIPFKDNALIGEGNEYVHVPFNWAEDMTIYRVRPNASMQAGNKYRGHVVKETQAVDKDGVWYWRLIS
ncbi:hypothetical protein LCGC14_0927070 [marine sediment metagenome]|uniref:Uncharacterized protein n=1 Tax=marine sediment metagenome TaxID=412755 RepID=A0A0F9R7S4_9ZZZZ